MSVDLIVQRGDGSKPGEDFESPLLTLAAVALEKGRNLLNEGARSYSPSLSVRYRKGIRPGQLAEVHDAAQGESWRGRIKSVNIRMTGVDSPIVVSMVLERPK